MPIRFRLCFSTSSLSTSPLASVSDDEPDELVVLDDREPSIVSTLFFLNTLWRLYALLLSLFLCCGDRLYTPVFILFIDSAIVVAWIMHRRRQPNDFIYLESNKKHTIIKEGCTIMSVGDNMQGKVNYEKWAQASVLVIGPHCSELLLYATNDKENVTLI